MVLTAQPAAAAEDDLDVEVLFKEARRRRRQRRISVAAAACVVLGTGVGLGIGLGAVGAAPPEAISGAEFARVVTNATFAAGSAQLTFTDRSFSPGPGPGLRHPSSASSTDVTQGSGVVDFAHQSMSYASVLRSTQSLPQGSRKPKVAKSVGPTLHYIQVGATFYSLRPPGIGRGYTAEAKAKLGYLLDRRWFAAPVEVATFLSSSYSARLVGVTTRPNLIGMSTVHGTPVTVYESRTTLARLNQVVASVSGQTRVASTTLVPTASSVEIQVRLSVDSKHRLIQMQVTEPSYAASYADGTGQAGAQVPATSNRGARRLSLAQWGSNVFIVTYSHFGIPTAISAPPAAKVATSAEWSAALQG